MCHLIRFFILDSTIAFNCVMEFHYIWNVAICFQYMVLMICCTVFHCRFVASENFTYVKVQINVRYTWDFFSKNGSFWNVSSLPWETTEVPHPKKGCNITNADLISVCLCRNSRSRDQPNKWSCLGAFICGREACCEREFCCLLQVYRALQHN